MNDKSAKPIIEMVTLKQLCAEPKVDPREAREKLRLAARDAKKNPNSPSRTSQGTRGSGRRTHRRSFYKKRTLSRGRPPKFA
jgi:hypothetical protein